MKVQKPRKNEEKRRSTQELHEHEGEQKSCASDPQIDSDSSCSSHGCRKASHEDIELAQGLIERCLQLYMTQDEVVAILVNRAKLDPGFTKLVWQKLEEENAEFFKAYYARLKLKKQITIFNLLLERQHQLMNVSEPQNAMPQYMQNGLLHVPGGPVNSSMGYRPPQLPYNPSNHHTHTESLQHDGSSYMVVDGIPALGSFYPIQATAANIAAGIKQEMCLSCSSTDCNSQFSTAPQEILQMSVDPMTFDAPFSSNMCSNDDLQLTPDNGNANILDNSYSHMTADLNHFADIGAFGHTTTSLFSLSDIDTLLNSPDQCDIVDDFIVDADQN